MDKDKIPINDTSTYFNEVDGNNHLIKAVFVDLFPNIKHVNVLYLSIQYYWFNKGNIENES